MAQSRICWDCILPLSAFIAAPLGHAWLRAVFAGIVSSLSRVLDVEDQVLQLQNFRLTRAYISLVQHHGNAPARDTNAEHAHTQTSQDNAIAKQSCAYTQRTDMSNAFSRKALGIPYQYVGRSL